MHEVIQVRLREAGKIFYFETIGEKPKIGDYVIVEQDRGIDYGEVVSEPETVLDKVFEEPLYKIIRVATVDDLNQIHRNKRKIKGAINLCMKKIQEHKLGMKLVDAEYSFDRTKIIFYFTAEGRVDFRNLVKDLAKIFKVRIELKQIGVRDEARLFGGIGPCGRKLCCATFLKSFEPVSIKMAKEEGLPLNPPKISGICGRLMCCLSYEYETYKQLSRGLPRQGERIHTPQGKGKVISVNIFKRTALIELEEGKQIEVSYR